MTAPIVGAIAGFNLVDLVILILVGVSAARGLRVGATIQLGSYIGFWIGLLGGAILAPYAAKPVPAGLFRTFASLVVLFGVASITAALGRAVGTRLSTKLNRVHLTKLDSGVGAIVSVISTLLIVWIVAALALNAPFAGLSAEVSGSQVVRALDEVLPPAPSLFAKVDSLFSTAGFPAVFASIPPALAGPVSLPPISQISAIERKVAPSVVKVEGLACSEIQEGSAFVVAPGYVATNAHVVAGEANPFVLDNGAQLAATVVLFDPHLDLAVLRVPGLSAPVLPFDTTIQSRGVPAVVMGYPEGGPLTYGSAGIMASFNATGRDIYNQGLTARLVYEIDAIVRPGNSGGPLINLKGQVMGVVFSRSTTDQYVGFALAAPAVAREVQSAIARPPQPVSTQGCVP
ncbi:MAG: MarP family serine protease [Ferrimicrobium sp.]